MSETPSWLAPLSPSCRLSIGSEFGHSKRRRETRYFGGSTWADAEERPNHLPVSGAGAGAEQEEEEDPIPRHLVRYWCHPSLRGQSPSAAWATSYPLMFSRIFNPVRPCVDGEFLYCRIGPRHRDNVEPMESYAVKNHIVSRAWFTKYHVHTFLIGSAEASRYGLTLDEMPSSLWRFWTGVPMIALDPVWMDSIDMAAIEPECRYELLVRRWHEQPELDEVVFFLVERIRRLVSQIQKDIAMFQKCSSSLDPN